VLHIPFVPPPLPIMIEDALHLSVEEAIWEGDSEALCGQEDSPDVNK